jgi:hypothetical protein
MDNSNSYPKIFTSWEFWGGAPLPDPAGRGFHGVRLRQRNASVSSLASRSGAGTSSALARNATDINFCDAVAPIVRPAPFVRNR